MHRLPFRPDGRGPAAPFVHREVGNVKEKELKRLNRAELLELLIGQAAKMDEMELRLQESEERLKERNISIVESGTLAEAALKLSGIFKAADDAASRYVESIRENSQHQEEINSLSAAENERKMQELREKTERECEEKRARADEILAKAKKECAAMKAEAEEIMAHCEQSCRARKQEVDDYAALVYTNLRKYMTSGESGEENE